MKNFCSIYELVTHLDSLNEVEQLKMWNAFCDKHPTYPKILKATNENISKAYNNDLSQYLNDVGNDHPFNYDYMSVDADGKIEYFDYINDHVQDSPYDDVLLATWLLSDNSMHGFLSNLNNLKIGWFDSAEANAPSLIAVYHAYKNSKNCEPLTNIVPPEPVYTDFPNQQDFMTAWLDWADTNVVPNYWQF